jgi:hypothetical protein
MMRWRSAFLIGITSPHHWHSIIILSLRIIFNLGHDLFSGWVCTMMKDADPQKVNDRGHSFWGKEKYHWDQFAGIVTAFIDMVSRKSLSANTPQCLLQT